MFWSHWSQRDLRRVMGLGFAMQVVPVPWKSIWMSCVESFLDGVQVGGFAADG